MGSDGWSACVKVETVEGSLVVVADDSPCHHLLPLPHCGYDKPVLVFLPNSACDPMTSWILSNREGAFADFLLLGANPLDGFAVMGWPDEYLRAVVKDGRCVRSTVNGLKVEVNLYSA